MTYQCRIKEAMGWLGHQKDTVFIGEGLKNAGEIYGTLTGVHGKKCIEFPICENLIVGSAIGLAIQGYKPVVIFQRMDFLLIASDAIINHLCLITQGSGGQFTLPVIIRAIIGSQNPKFDVGDQHKHDFTHIFERYMPIVSLSSKSKILNVYKKAYTLSTPIMVVERRDLYDQD